MLATRVCQEETGLRVWHASVTPTSTQLGPDVFLLDEHVDNSVGFRTLTTLEQGNGLNKYCDNGFSKQRIVVILQCLRIL